MNNKNDREYTMLYCDKCVRIDTKVDISKNSELDMEV